MEKQWEKHLFRNDAIVPVKFKRNEELEPLSILILSRRKNGRPMLSRLGSILDDNLRKPTSDTKLERRWKKVAKSLKNDLGEYRQGNLDEYSKNSQVEVSRGADIVESYTASVGILGSLSTMLHADANRSSSLFCNLTHNRRVSVRTQCLNDLFDAKDPLWRPNMAQFNIHRHILEDNGNFMMWVVTEIFTAKKLVIAKSRDDGVEAALNASQVLGDTTGCLGKAGLNCYRRRDKFAVINAPSGDFSFTYGFRAHRLQYDEHGILQRKDNNVGEDLPVFRGSDHSASALIEDRTYHMGDFFVNGPRTDDLASDSEATDHLLCLEWDDEDDDHPDLVFTESS